MPHLNRINSIVNLVTIAPPANSLAVERLTEAHEDEVLKFLVDRSIDQIFMTGLISDNGLESPFNRGAFYSCRDDRGRLAGVALIGHATLVATESDEALAAFSALAARHPDAHVIVGEEAKINRFWQFYQHDGQSPNRLCRELLVELRWPAEAREAVPELRRATLDELAPVMAVNAWMALQESGVNPLSYDPDGFRLRLARRIAQGRVWVWIEQGRLLFKADVMTDTSCAAYLEGIHVHPSERRRRIGLRCMAQLGQHLLSGTKRLCLLVNEQNQNAQSFYFRAGYKLTGCYDTFFLKSRKS